MLKRRVPLELLTLQEHLSSPPVFSGVSVARSFVFYVVFCIICPFSFDHCIDCPSIYLSNYLFDILKPKGWNDTLAFVLQFHFDLHQYML